MKQMMNNDDFINLLPFIEGILKFYANKDNYKRDSNNAIIFSPIQMDSGNMANFALTKIKEINELYEKNINDIKDNINDIDINKEVKNKIKELKNIANNI